MREHRGDAADEPAPGLELKPRKPPTAAILDAVQRPMSRRQALSEPAAGHAERPRGMVDGEAGANEELQLDPRALQGGGHGGRTLPETRVI
jgi:hypothetical protein